VTTWVRRRVFSLDSGSYKRDDQDRDTRKPGDSRMKSHEETLRGHLFGGELAIPSGLTVAKGVSAFFPCPQIPE